MNLDFGVAVAYLPHLLQAAGLTIFLALTSQAIGTGLGTLLALGRSAGPRWLSAIIWVYVWIFRGTPMLLHLFFIYYAAPLFGLTLDALPAAIIAMSLSTTAYSCEIIRSGIQAIHHGQIEAARAVGMTYPKIVRRIIMPQAIRIIIPPYMSNFISHTKNTSLASVITVPELMLTAQMIYSSTYRAIEILSTAGLIYLFLTSCLTWLQLYFERATAYEKRGLSERRKRLLGVSQPS
ncbi:MAG: amino acid ABC transporter permease [Alphaproteobacteria bacterium]|nr:amino acid ABC transporter permease [Alphaproteobacteria bacterium]